MSILVNDANEFRKFKDLLGSEDLSSHEIIQEAIIACPKQHIINSDLTPYIPPYWKVQKHMRGGIFSLNLVEIEMSLCDDRLMSLPTVNDLRIELKDKPVFNARVLDYLLAHQEIIPKEWKEMHIPFLGTIYLDNFGFSCVRFLCWIGHGWDWTFRCLEITWSEHQSFYSIVS